MIKRISCIIKDLFKNYNQKEDTEKEAYINEDYSNVSFNIIFSVDTSNKVDIDFNILEISENTARQLGLFLFYISNGKLSGEIINSLFSLGNNSFINYVIEEWKNRENTINETPLVSPIEALSFEHRNK